MTAGGAAAGDRRLRVLVDGPAPASWNMALDEALLELGTTPVLRLYAWAPHAVSLGWFQAAADFADLPPGTPVVRRLTGGGAIHHGDELTFALVCDAACLPTEIASGYRLLHDAAVAVLQAVGVPCRRLEHGAAPAARPGERWCFAEPGRDDVVTARGKLLGSAQRRVRRPRARVLHHGSLVLRRPSLTPFVAAVADHTDPDRAAPTLRSGLVRAIAAALDLVSTPDLPTAAERALAARLQQQRYADSGFTARR
ncbi:MAG: lipoate--protein ligase family protein [Planctomycetes bacterium]|nr:lipoate--protein ligase family protein [Planctomycetota bacterium]